MTTCDITQSNGDASPLQTKTVVLDIIFHRPGFSRKTPARDVVRDEFADAELRVRKDILESEHYDKANKAASKARAYAAKMSLRSPLRRGTFLIPVKALDDVYDKLHEYSEEFDGHVENFLAEYEERKESAKDRLKSLYDEKDYPAPQQLRAAFRPEWRLIEFGLPSPDKIGELAWKEEKAKAAKFWRDAEKDVMAALRSTMLDMTSTLARCLGTKPDGKKYALNSATVDNLSEFLDSFAKFRNVCEDDELAELVQNARDALCGANAESLRSSDTLRDIVKSKMDEIGKQVEALVEAMPVRAFSFED